MEPSKQKLHLQIYDRPSSIAKDGTRRTVYPADVHGRFATARTIVFVALIAFFLILPFWKIEGHPALFLDVPARRFHVFGQTFNAQDFVLVFFVMTGIAFALVVATAVLGRAFCGWVCPQTVFLEGIYRRIERWVEGPRNTRMRRKAEPISWAKAWRKALKHSLFVIVSLLLAHAFVAYFVSIPSLLEMIQRPPAENATSFGWAWVLSAIFYGNFAWFREQMCLVVCPYGRLQSVLIDDESLVVGYDAIRGEPRGKMSKTSDASKGDCIDCGRCVVVCPTGIDIRNGLQLDCVACTQCIDACDEVMQKIGRPKGLIRYDSLRGLAHESKKSYFVMRPRLWAYAGLGLVGVLVAGFFATQRTSLAANLLRMRGAPYVVTEGRVRNTFDLHVVSKTDDAALLQMQVRASSPWQVTSSTLPESLAGGAELHVVILAECEQAPCQGDGVPKVFVELRDPTGGVIRREASLLFPDSF